MYLVKVTEPFRYKQIYRHRDEELILNKDEYEQYKGKVDIVKRFSFKPKMVEKQEARG